MITWKQHIKLQKFLNRTSKLIKWIVVGKLQGYYFM